MAVSSGASLVTFLVTLSLCYCSPVPFVSWWTDNSIQSPTVFAGHSFDKNHFESLYKPILSNTDILVFFTQDELSVDDFTRYSGSFPFIKQSLEENNHVIITSVLQKEDTVLDYVKSMNQSNVIELPTGSYLSEIQDQLKNNILNIINVKLEPIRKADDGIKSDILKSNDIVVKSIVSKLSKLSKKLAVVLTSEILSLDVSSILVNEELDNNHNIKSRHILADETSSTNSSGKALNSDCVLMYFEGLTFQSVHDTNSSAIIDLIDFIDIVENKTVDGDCSLNTYQIVLKFNNAKSPFGKDFSLTINLMHVNATGEWSCKSIEPNGKYNGSRLNDSIDCGMQDIPWKKNSYNTIVSPFQYSFACDQMSFSSKNYIVRFKSLQLQPINNGTSPRIFKDAYNCEGFFTLEILTGLFVGLLLISMLFLGTTMMLNIQTQDRFDDPRGKTISVTAQE